MNLAAHLAAMEALRARPGPRLVTLHTAEDPWDADPGLVPEVQDGLEALCQALIELLARRWGEPHTLDPAALPDFDPLCPSVDELYGWHAGGRWTALGIQPHTPDAAGRLIAVTGVVSRPSGD